MQSYPSLSSAFIFGGAWHNLDAITKSCDANNCFTLSSDVQEFVDPLTKDDLLFILIISASVLIALTLFVIVIKRWFRGKNGFGGNKDAISSIIEKGTLIQNNGHSWGGDVFSSDLDLEELEWGFEMKQVY